MNKMLSFCCFGVLLFFAFLSNASEIDSLSTRFRIASGSRYDNYIGYSSSFLLGEGISYRRWIGERGALQLTVGPFKVTDKSSGRYIPSLDFCLAPILNNVNFSYFRLVWFASFSMAYFKPDNAFEHIMWFAAGGSLEYNIWHFCSAISLGASTINGRLGFFPDFAIYYRF
jgi:hypothetical protein